EADGPRGRLRKRGKRVLVRAPPGRLRRVPLRVLLRDAGPVPGWNGDQTWKQLGPDPPRRLELGGEARRRARAPVHQSERRPAQVGTDAGSLEPDPPVGRRHPRRRDGLAETAARDPTALNRSFHRPVWYASGGLTATAAVAAGRPHVPPPRSPGIPRSPRILPAPCLW